MSNLELSSLAKRLNLKDDMKIRVIAKPGDVELEGIQTTTSNKADGIIVFVKMLSEVDEKCTLLFDIAKEDRIAWVVYPKGGQLGTDLNRDILWNHMQKKGLQGVRIISLNNIWSALRFRPEK